MSEKVRPMLSPEEVAELTALIERYAELPDGPKDTIERDIGRIESLADRAYERRRTTPEAHESEEERALLDRAESLIPLLKVCMPGDR